MIYDSLDTIPYKLFLKIADTGDVSLLSTNGSGTNLNVIWDKIYNEHISKNQTSESKKVFKLSKNIDELLATNKVIIMACTSLGFDFNQEMYDIIISYGFQLSIENTESYYSDLDRVLREAKSYVIKAEYYKNMLPEKNENEGEKEQYNTDNIMASYSAILGYSIGKHNDITHAEYYAHQKSVNAKIDSIKSQNTNSNGR